MDVLFLSLNYYQRHFNHTFIYLFSHCEFGRIMKDDISSYIDEIISAIGDDLELSREDIEKEFRRFLEYGVPPDQAKESIVKKFGKDKLNRKLLKDVVPNERNLNLICKIITKNVKEVNIRG